MDAIHHAFGAFGFSVHKNATMLRDCDSISLAKFCRRNQLINKHSSVPSSINRALTNDLQLLHPTF